jgi:hypothetical protein
MALPFVRRINDAHGATPLQSQPLAGTALLAIMLTLALAFRLFLAVATDFPINDGALFYEFVKGVANSFPGLPTSVRYNGMDVPFAYPPLSFWIAGWLTRLGFDPLDIVHYLPIALNAAYVLLIALLLLRNGHSRVFAAIALLFFAARLRSFEWLVMGGGLSRGLGALFLVLTLLAISVPGPRQERLHEPPLPLWRAALAGGLVGAALLSHLEWGVLAAAAFALSRALAARSFKEFTVTSAVGGAASLLIILPWLLFVHGEHGLEPFLAAGGTAGWSLKRSAVRLIAFFLNNLTNPFLLIGAYIVLRRQDYFWPGFILLCLLVTPRHGQTPVSLPLAVLSAYGVIAGWEMLKGFVSKRGPAFTVATSAVLLTIVVHEWPQYRKVKDFFQPLPSEERQAMDWIRERHGQSSFAVLTTAIWSYDASAEWLPTLTGARSITTVQGREWRPNQEFRRFDDQNQRVLASETCPGLLRRLRFYGRPDFVWAETMRGCFRAPDYAPVYHNAKVTIFRVSSEAAQGRSALSPVGRAASSTSADASVSAATG